VRGETIARNYASALFALALRDDQVEAYGHALDQVVDLIDQSADVRLFLDTPRVSLAEKKEVLRRALADQIPLHVLNFLLLALDKRRQRLIPAFAEAYRGLVDAHLGRSHVTVEVARSLGSEELDGVAAELSRILQKQAIPHVRVRPELIGGIIFRSGDTIFDGSVRRRLQRMRRQLMTTDVSTDQG
jgi:F-type H+-transporting ATPase subunit delta